MILLKQFGVAHVAHKLSGNLSGGQMQRIAVARNNDKLEVLQVRQ